ncbi:MAG: response regulator, partial [Spirochaetes bacterium]|nr:response regulator [Spirochaetota bacterium]
SREDSGGILRISVDKIFADRFFCQFHSEAKEIYYWVIMIKDTGIGIAKETMEKIFDPFFSTKKKEKGSGLGLSMVYNIVQQHKGFITIYSEVDEGTSFKVYLPMSIETEESVISEKADDNVIRGEGLVLVIDDENLMRILARDILQAGGYDVIDAEDGLMGIELYKKHQKDIVLILLDLAMPKISGLETYHQLKKINPRIKVLMTSGFSADKRIEQGLSDGVAGFLSKPFTLYDLTKKAHEVLNK